MGPGVPELQIEEKLEQAGVKRSLGNQGEKENMTSVVL